MKKFRTIIPVFYKILKILNYHKKYYNNIINI